jgi:hypothetical protein
MLSLVHVFGVLDDAEHGLVDAEHQAVVAPRSGAQLREQQWDISARYSKSGRQIVLNKY